MKQIVMLILMIACVGLTACVGPEETKETKLNLDDFKKLEIGTSIEDVKKKFGDEKEDLGSGLHILVYEIDKDNNVILNFDPENKLSKVTLPE